MGAHVQGDTVTVTHAIGKGQYVTFTFSDVQLGRQKFEALLAVDPFEPAGDLPAFKMHIVTTSVSNVNQFRLALEGYFGREIDWKTVLPRVCQEAQQAYVNDSKLVDPSAVALDDAWAWAVDRLFVENELNVVFGQGESAKSYLAQHAAMCSTAGHAWLGRGTKLMKWVWLDYESGTPKRFAMRQQRLLMGDTPLAEDAIHWMPGRGIPITEYLPTVRREMQRVNADGLIVDSLMFACGGDALQQMVATNVCNALTSLEKTVIGIAHVTKDEQRREAELYPFGSIFWHNGAHGFTWNLKRQSEPGSDLVEVGWFNRKASDGGRQPSFGVRMHFDGETGPVTLEPCKVVDIPELESSASFSERIKAHLRNRRLTVGQIVELLSDGRKPVKEDTVRKTLNRMKENQTLVQVFEDGTIYWAIREQREDIA